ncbi:DUF58 domain-containing protein [Candidatus Woesearchaeota archaeon]|jgi:uncharacterized protein (DUF58 family)|nr:DUF58 domain-containing protein [Candidatus Woesearchaeota archaeon]MBT5215793.1 DUF58 domain-containing protein [Candidatus Woesearchaeota archaeon]MBT6402152.1 DUF58 domain-containing protein [Candidatus Woesearchaeota archaeon]
MIESDFLKHLDRMSLLVSKRISSNYIGERKSLQTGRGTLFKDHGMYTPGDDFRAIDWKVYGRTDKLHIKRYEEDKALVTHIILDASSSMDYASGKVKKFDYASMVGLAFAYMAMKKNEKFVLSTFSENLDFIVPRKGKRHFVSVIDHLKTKEAKGKSKFEESLMSYLKKIESRSMIVVVSDFFYDLDEIERSLGRFKNSEIRLIQVLDQVESNLNLKGDLNLRDMETSEVVRTFVDKVTKSKYLKKKNEHNAKLKWIADSLGAKFYSFSTDKPIFDSIYEVLRN